MMVRRHAGAVLEGLDRIFHRGTVAGLSEGGLLDRFVDSADETAFAALVSRHGPMVLGVCRRALRDEHDVEDAFQATFLVLVRRAGSIRDGELVGHWLHGVAHRVAVRARANAARRHDHEPLGIQVDPAQEHAPPLDDVSMVLDDELARLPESLRAPVVLCYLEGLTHDEAAQKLGWPVGTVRSRMSRARDLLQRRLTRRGISAPGVAMFPALATHQVSTTLINSTVQLALASATETTAATLLAQGALTAMMISKLKFFGTAIVLGALTMGAVQTFARPFGPPKPDPIPTLPVDRKDGLSQDIRKYEAKEASLKADLAEVTKQKEHLVKELADLTDPKPTKADPNVVKGPIPKYFRAGDMILSWTPEGDKVVVYHTQTGKSQAVRLTDTKTIHQKITPLIGSVLVAIYAEGPKVDRLAVYNSQTQTWQTQKLAEPVDKAVPVMGTQVVCYTLGRYVYAFGSIANRWDVLELPVGAKPTAVTAFATVTVEHDGHIYDFTSKTGKWLDLDTRSLLDAPDDSPKP